MNELNIDAIVYPTWNNKPALIESFEEGYKGDNNQIIAPHTGQPAFTVPMGFTEGNLPAGLQFLGRMYSEPLPYHLWVVMMQQLITGTLEVIFLVCS